MYVSMFLGPGVAGPEQDQLVIEASIERALEADESGFGALYVGEQHFNNYEPYSNPFVMMGYLAGQIKNAYLGTSVSPLVVHHPLLLIERMNLLDLLTRGKVVFGMSSGRPRRRSR